MFLDLHFNVVPVRSHDCGHRRVAYRSADVLCALGYGICSVYVRGIGGGRHVYESCFTRKVLQAGKLELKEEDTDCTAWKQELVKMSEIKTSRKTP